MSKIKNSSEMVLVLAHGRHSSTDLNRCDSLPRIALTSIDGFSFPSTGNQKVGLWSNGNLLGSIEAFYGNYFYAGLWFANAFILPKSHLEASSYAGTICTNFDPNQAEPPQPTNAIQ